MAISKDININAKPCNEPKFKVGDKVLYKGLGPSEREMNNIGMKIGITFCTITVAWTIARCAEAQDKKGECYQGDYIVNPESREDEERILEEIKTLRCINGDLIWKMSFYYDNGAQKNVKKVSFPNLVKVDTIEIEGAYIVELDFPLLIKRRPNMKDAEGSIVNGTVPVAEYIDASRAPMLCCYQVSGLAWQSGAGINRTCRTWGCEP